MIRKICAVLCGILAGFLLLNSITSGLELRFAQEVREQPWGMLIWGDHWFLRALTSVICTAWAGFIAGLIGRRRGSILALIAAFPGWLLWTASLYVSFTGQIPFLPGTEYYHISLGYKIFSVIVVIVTFPIAWFAGRLGEEMVEGMLADHFDSRPRTLLGLKWFHYLWTPIIIHLAVMQTSYAVPYIFPWFKAAFKAQFSILAWFIPGVVTAILFGTLFLIWNGLSKAYLILAGFQKVDSKKKAFLHLLLYSIVLPGIGAFLEYGVEFTHFKITQWLS